MSRGILLTNARSRSVRKVRHWSATMVTATAEDVHAAPEVIIGMFLDNFVHASVLFDSGATHSFISRKFVGQHNIRVESLSNAMIITTPVIRCQLGSLAHRCP